MCRDDLSCCNLFPLQMIYPLLQVYSTLLGIFLSYNRLMVVILSHYCCSHAYFFPLFLLSYCGVRLAVSVTGIELHHAQNGNEKLDGTSLESLVKKGVGQSSGLLEGSATARLGVRDFEIHWISSGFRISEWISGFQSGFLDFWISKWISGFQSGFLDFKVDFWISKWISGFQSGFLDFKADFWISKWISRGISGFQANFWISKRISGFHLNMAILSMI